MGLTARIAWSIGSGNANMGTLYRIDFLNCTSSSCSAMYGWQRHIMPDMMPHGLTMHGTATTIRAAIRKFTL